MKSFIQRDSFEQLEIVFAPRLWTYIISGAIFVAAGLFVLYVLALKTDLSAENQRLGYHQAWFGIWPKRSHQFDRSEISTIDTTVVEWLGGRSLEIQIATKLGSAILPLPSTDGTQKEAIVSELRRWHTEGAPPVLHSSNDVLPASVLGAACIIGGIICWLAIQRISISADRINNAVTIRRQSLLLKPYNLTVSLASLQTIQSEAVTLSTHKHTTASYQISIEDGNSDRHSLAFMPVFTDAEANQLIATIKNWLNRST